MKAGIVSSLLPFCTVFLLSLFGIWEWFVQRSFNPDMPRTLDIPLTQMSAGHPSDRLIAGVEGALSIDDALGRERNRCRCVQEEVRRARGPSLLHSWSDEELFDQAVAHELGGAVSSVLGNAAPEEDGPDDGCPPCFQREYGPLQSSAVKIAFLFLITERLPFEALWNKFFEGKEGFYSVYVHADPLSSSILFNNSRGVFSGRLIPSKKALRGDPSLVQASQRLLSSALIDDPLNQYFALLSDHCIPIRGFDYVYNYLTSSNRSFLEITANHAVMRERYVGREGGPFIMMPDIPFEVFRKGSQWYVLLRRHALMVVQDKKYWSRFNHPCKIMFCGTDEHYYPTLMNILDPNGSTGYTVTYVEWPPWVSEHPVTFVNSTISKQRILQMQQLHGGRYLFARKFKDDTLSLLMQMSATILRN